MVMIPAQHDDDDAGAEGDDGLEDGGGFSGGDELRWSQWGAELAMDVGRGFLRSWALVLACMSSRRVLMLRTSVSTTARRELMSSVAVVVVMGGSFGLGMEFGGIIAWVGVSVIPAQAGIQGWGRWL